MPKQAVRRVAGARTGLDGVEARFLLYSHDGLGLGHFRRNLVLADALIAACPNSSVLLACAAEGLETFTLPDGVDVLRLPGLRKVDNGHYVGRRLNLGPDELRALRASLLESAVRHFRPHVLLADKHPIGVNGELLAAIRLHKAAGGRTVLGLRDVLDDPESASDEWRASGMAEHIERIHERVLVYGTASLLSPIGKGFLSRPAADKVRFCGYVLAEPAGDEGGPAPLASTGVPRVLAMAGGGEDGSRLLATFVRASEEGAWQGILVAGPQMPTRDWTRLQAAASRAGVVALRAVPNVQRWLPRMDALVCMGGYNSLLEAVTSGTPTVCVPRARPRQEQLVRARAFAARGLLELVEPDELSSRTLRRGIEAALGSSREALLARAGALDLQGARRAAQHLVELVDGAGAPSRSSFRQAAAQA